MFMKEKRQPFMYMLEILKLESVSKLKIPLVTKTLVLPASKDLQGYHPKPSNSKFKKFQ